MAQLTQEQITDLELLIDASDLATVMLVLADICDEKAEHIRSNWQDQSTALPWSKDAKTLRGVVRKLWTS